MALGALGVPGAAALGSRVAMGCFWGCTLLCVSGTMLCCVCHEPTAPQGSADGEKGERVPEVYQLIVFQRLDHCFYLFPCIQPFVSAELHGL